MNKIELIFFIVFLYTFSYDGFGNGIVEPPNRGNSPSSSPSRFTSKNLAAGSGRNWRSSSAGSSDFRRGSPARCSTGICGVGGNSNMAELNIPRGHSPHFSPSRNTSKYFNSLNFRRTTS